MTIRFGSGLAILALLLSPAVAQAGAVVVGPPPTNNVLLSANEGTTLSNPVPLTSFGGAAINEVSGSIGGTGATSQFFEFSWGGGYLGATGTLTNVVGTPDIQAQLYQAYPSPPTLLASDTFAPGSDPSVWEVSLPTTYLSAGIYVMGIVESAGPDPDWSIGFSSPVGPAVPEPAGMGLLGAGLVGLVAVRRRKAV